MRQVLVDKAPNSQDHRIASLSEANILSKANLAIKNMSLTDPLNPLPKVIGIKKLPSGALSLEMGSEDSAEVMQQTTISTDFISSFSDSSTVKPNNYPIIAEFVLIAFNPTLQENITEIEVC